MMKYFNNKRLAQIVFIATLIPAGTVQAGWSDTFMATARGFMQDTAMPYLKKPETYVLAAAAAVGSYFAGRELYWGLKSELPHNRAVDYLRSGLSGKVQNQEAANSLHALVAYLPQVDQLSQDGNRSIKKNILNELIKKQTCDYEFGCHETVRRIPDWEFNDIPVMDHSRVVCLQTGSNCGYHAAFNAAHLLQLFKTNSRLCRDVYCDAIKAGPPIAEWKNVIAGRYHTNQSDQSYENITDEAVQTLMVGQLHISRDDFTCIANPSQDPALLDENLPKIITALQNGTKKAHAFLLGNMRDDFSIGGSGGHWITAVVTTDDGMKVRVADSISGRLEERQQTVNQLIELLRQNTEWTAIKADIDSRLETAKNILEQNNDYNGCEDILKDIFKQIDTASDTVRIEFRAEYDDHITHLVDEIKLRREEEAHIRNQALTSMHNSLQGVAASSSSEASGRRVVE